MPLQFPAMKIIHAAKELKPGSRKACLAIGFFDGVHLGHQQIIRQTVADARQHDAIALVITFDRHPNVVVLPERVPPLIYSLPQKLGAIESLATDTLLLIHFDRAFSDQNGEMFIRGLARDLGFIHSICVGADFVFGHKRSGNVALLKNSAANSGSPFTDWPPCRSTVKSSAARAFAKPFAPAIWMSRVRCSDGLTRFRAA